MAEILWHLREIAVGTRLRIGGLTIHAGITAVVGPSGAGKSTLIRLLAETPLTPHAATPGSAGASPAPGSPGASPGRFAFEPRTPAVARAGEAPAIPGAGEAPALPGDGTRVPKDRLPVFWSPDGGWWPGFSVRRTVLTVCPSGTSPATVDALLADFQLSHRAEALPERLSAGERDRLAVVRGVASGARVLLLDEPFAHLDESQAAGLWAVLLQRLARSGMSLVFASHAPEQVVGWADRVICLGAGEVLAEGPVEALYRDPPTPAVAACLGPHTWLDQATAHRWFGPAAAAGCLRPERVLVMDREPDGSVDQRAEGISAIPGAECNSAIPGGAIPGAEVPVAVVIASRFHGAVTVTEVERDGERLRVLHRSIQALPVGRRVALRLLQLVVMVGVSVGLVACGGLDDTTPTDGTEGGANRITVIQVPPDGGVQPSPRGVAALASGEWLVLDTAGRVLVYGQDRTLHRQWHMPAWDVGRPENACGLPDGTIAVADTHYHRIVWFDAQGAVLRTLGSEGDGPAQFRWPVGVCADTSGNLYVSEYGGNDRIQKIDQTGKVLATFGSFGSGPGQFQRPQNIQWHDGRLFVADAMNNRVQVWTDAGVFVGIVGGDQPPELRFPYAALPAADGTISVVEYGAGRITRLSATGKVLSRLGTAGRGDGELATPWGMALDARGVLLVADTGNRRLVEVAP